MKPQEQRVCSIREIVGLTSEDSFSFSVFFLFLGGWGGVVKLLTQPNNLVMV